MRTNGPLTTYNRTIARWVSKPGAGKLANSMLAYFGAGEATFIQRFVQVSDADRTTYV